MRVRRRWAHTRQRLYTDAHVTGQVRDDLGPYQLLNPIDTTRLYGSRGLGVGVVLRVEQHLDPPMPTPEDMSRTSAAHYLGGASTSDQIACLLALALGVRFRSGGETRVFDLDDPDPRGRPLYATHRTPVLALADRHAVPAASGRTVLLNDAISMLALLPALEPDAATQVLRSARLYRQALWISDEDAELAWLLLVSALEVGATHWASGRDTPAARLQHALPDLADVLRSAGGDDLVEQAAPTVAALTRPTARFLDFVTTFAADPPVDRPDHQWAQVDWSKLKKVASKVYGYRSAVLHAGHPMPGPTLEVPWQGDMTHPAERPLGLGSAHGSTTWAPSDLPINLNTFAILTRQALLGWIAPDSLLARALAGCCCVGKQNGRFCSSACVTSSVDPSKDGVNRFVGPEPGDVKGHGRPLVETGNALRVSFRRIGLRDGLHALAAAGFNDPSSKLVEVADEPYDEKLRATGGGDGRQVPNEGVTVIVLGHVRGEHERPVPRRQAGDRLQHGVADVPSSLPHVLRKRCYTVLRYQAQDEVGGVVVIHESGFAACGQPLGQERADRVLPGSGQTREQ